MAIHAIEFDRGSRLGVELSISVGVLLEVAVHAVHALFFMNVRKMNCFLEFIRGAGLDDFVFGVEQISLAVSFVDRSEDPAMAVKIGELRLFQL